MGMLVDAEAVGRNSKDGVFQTACNHGLLTVGKNEVGGMTKQICPLKGQGPRNLRKGPVEADHHTYAHTANFSNPEREVSRVEASLFRVEKMELSIGVNQAFRTDQKGAIINLVSLSFGKPCYEVEFLFTAEGNEPVEGWGILRVLSKGKGLLTVFEEIPRKGKFGKNDNICAATSERRNDPRKILLDPPETGIKLVKTNGLHG